jgi:hypothetical protein
MFSYLMGKVYYRSDGPAANPETRELWEEVTEHMVACLAATMEHIAHTWLQGARQTSNGKGMRWESLQAEVAQSQYERYLRLFRTENGKERRMMILRKITKQAREELGVFEDPIEQMVAPLPAAYSEDLTDLLSDE